MILKSIKNKNTKDAIILIVLFVLYWFFVFLQNYFVNSFLNPVFSSVFWHIFMSLLGFIAILSPFLIIANTIRGLVESSPGFKERTARTPCDVPQDSQG